MKRLMFVMTAKSGGFLYRFVLIERKRGKLIINHEQLRLLYLRHMPEGRLVAE